MRVELGPAEPIEVALKAWRRGINSRARRTEPADAGTRLTVVESGFAQLPEDAHDTAYGGNTEGWASELGELAGYLDAAA